MIYVHYDSITGKVLGAFDSSNDTIPEPNIPVTEYYWSQVCDDETRVDLSTLSLVQVTKKYSDEEISELRRATYIKEADPLFFKWQRKECTKKDWLDKIKEIKLKYPKSTD